MAESLLNRIKSIELDNDLTPGLEMPGLAARARAVQNQPVRKRASQPLANRLETATTVAVPTKGGFRMVRILRNPERGGLYYEFVEPGAMDPEIRRAIQELLRNMAD